MRAEESYTLFDLADFCFRWRWLFLSLAVFGAVAGGLTQKMAGSNYNLRLIASVHPAGTPIDSVDGLVYQAANAIRIANPDLNVDGNLAQDYVQIDMQVPEGIDVDQKAAPIRQALDAYAAMVNNRVDRQFEIVKGDFATTPTNSAVYEKLLSFRTYVSRRDADNSRLFFVSKKLTRIGTPFFGFVALGTFAGFVLALAFGSIAEFRKAWAKRSHAAI